jgi:short-subunit dehydrogenase
MNLKGAKCVVTGASSGIGLEVVKRLVDKGAVVLAASRGIEGHTELSQWANVYLLNCDVSDPQSVDLLFDSAQNILGDIDLFYANAGFAYWGCETKADWKRIEDIFRVNAFSPFYSLQKLRELKHGKPFNFVITASGMSYVSLPGYALYSATKGALKRFAEAYEYELSRGQVLSLVYPIATRTNFFNNAQAEHVPFPTQDVESVADSIIKGIEKDQKHIYPSRLFRIALALFSLFPFSKSIYLNSQDNLHHGEQLL